MKDNDVRTLDDINEILHLAKLSENDIIPTSQVVYFTKENFYNNNLKLLQLDQSLDKEITEGNTLFIKGGDDEEVVICSESKTFNVTSAETSNSLLLVENMKFNDDIKFIQEPSINKVVVSAIFYEYLEASLGKPHLNKLHDILYKTIYKGPEHEHEINEQNLYSFEDLNNNIQSSTKELQGVLETMDVVVIKDKIRLLDFEYHFRVLSYMLKLIDENSWQLDEIDFEETMNALADLVPSEVVNSLFDKYCEESKIIDGLQLYSYKEIEICRFFAKVLLRDSGKFNLNDFLQAWQDSVPEGMVTSEEMLYGVAIINRKSQPNVIWAFDEDSLPENINERFKILFDIKEKWTVEEIAPYVRRLTTEKIDVNALLAKHARASKVGDVKYYSAKHAK